MRNVFDSIVCERRNQVPWARIDFLAFAREMAFEGEVVLRIRYRPDVATRFWYVLEWPGEDGKTHRAESQEFQLCLWRAAQIELDARAKKESDKN